MNFERNKQTPYSWVPLRKLIISVTQQNTNTLWIRKIRYSVHEEPATCSYVQPDETNPHWHPFYFFKIHFNRIFSNRSSQWRISFRFSYQNFLCTSLPSFYTPCPSHPVLFDHFYNILQRIKILRQSSFASPLLSNTNILLTALFSDTLSLCSCLSVLYQASSPCKPHVEL
jgi:hypothetical protein